MSRDFHRRHKEDKLLNTLREWAWHTLLLVVTMAILLPQPTHAFVALFTQEPMIVKQQSYQGSCVDLTEWTTSAGSCDKVVCYVEPSGIYTVSHSCRPREPYENPDDTNCQWVTNSTLPFPDCCPQLECGVAGAVPTVNPSACLDIASSFACGVWKNLTSGCNDRASTVYNITQVYCNNTCGFC